MKGHTAQRNNSAAFIYKWRHHGGLRNSFYHGNQDKCLYSSSDNFKKK